MANGSSLGERAVGRRLPRPDDVVRDAFYAAITAAGLERLYAKPDPIVFHACGTRSGLSARRTGSTSSSNQAWMGHADIQTTRRYRHYAPKHDDAARVSAAFGGGSVHPAVHRTADIAA